MINQQLLDYINQQGKQGLNQEQIKSSLAVSGWSSSDIEEGFATVASGSSSMPISYAGFWLRTVATIADQFIFGLIFGILASLCSWFYATLFDVALSNGTEIVVEIVVFIIYLVVWILYFPFMESRGGATFGKKILGIKVLNDNNEPVGFLRSLGRNLAKIISGMILMIGFIMAGFTKKKQGLHDIIANCVVVRSREVSVGKICAIIILVIVIPIGLFVMAGAILFSMLSNMFTGSTRNNHEAFYEPTSVTQTQDNGKSIAISPESTFVPLTREEYDTYFSKPITGLDNESTYMGPRAYAGPALIVFDDFWGLRNALPVIPNLENNKDRVWIDITSIISKNGQDILDRESSFEKDIFFKGLNFSKETQPFEYFSDDRSLNYIRGAESSDAKTIKGVLFFKIPLDSENSSNFYEKSYPFTINI